MFVSENGGGAELPVQISLRHQPGPSMSPGAVSCQHRCVYGCADIRNTVNYKEVMSQYNMGPNGAITTSLNLFTTVFDQASLTTFKETNTDVDRNIYVSNRKRYTTLINFNKKKYLQEKQELLKNARDSANFWKTIATLKDKSYIQGNITILEWQCFYNKLLSAETTIGSDLSTLSRIDPELYREISITEITREISSLANEKACGADEIPNEALKTLPFEHLVTLKNIFNRIINSGSYPLIWSKSIIHPIFKSGDRDNPSNYRGIAHISNLSKLFTSILKSRLRNWIEGRSIIPENQAGFRKGYSCQDHIFTLLSLIQLTLRRKRRKLYAFFVDLKKAFDTVPHSLLWSKLGELGLDLRFVNLIRNYFEQMTTTLMKLVGERAKDNEFIIIDTPGQMEVFNWSASGSIITKALCAVSVQASTYPTILVFLLDLKQCQHPNSLLTNLLSCCSIMFLHKLPILAVMNKLDQSEPTNVLNWMNDFSEFRLAFDSTPGFQGTINSSLCMVLDDFYRGLNTVALSSETGQGMEALFPAIYRAVEDYYRDFKPIYERLQSQGLRVHQLWIKILWCNWQGRSEFTSHEKLSRAVTVLQRGRSMLQESKRWVLIFLEDQLSNFHTCFCHPIALRESRT
ncbi:GPN1 [Cordylochernes scorpioides]|uniref:GPN1 n=1 Tax=Cordylochernes scorpioides TaxID=51811 RepID=A0ABY6K188_9ARAC|nr:GPN1 [Cordylochernes scorpioides]